MFKRTNDARFNSELNLQQLSLHRVSIHTQYTSYFGMLPPEKNVIVNVNNKRFILQLRFIKNAVTRNYKDLITIIF